MSKYGIQTKGTGAVMGRSSYAAGGRAANPRKKLGPRRPKRKGRPSLGDDAGPRTGRPSTGPKGLPKGLPRRPFDNTDKTPKPKNFDNTDRTDREKIISDKIRRNKIKDRLDKLKQKMKAGPIGAGLNPDKLKKSVKNLKDQMAGRQGKAGGGRMNTSRMNRLEELGRVDSEKAYTSKGKRNLRDEKKRIVKEVAGR